MEQSERQQLLERLIRYEVPIEPVLGRLATLRFDSATELITLRRADVLFILDRFMRRQLTADQVTDWADQVEVRDDIGFEVGFEELLRDVIFGLANPNLREKVSTELAEHLWAKLEGGRADR